MNSNLNPEEKNQKLASALSVDVSYHDSFLIDFLSEPWMFGAFHQGFKFPAFSCLSWPFVSDNIASSPLKASAIHHCYRKSMMSSVTTLEIWQSRCSSHTSMLFSEPQIFETMH